MNHISFCYFFSIWAVTKPQASVFSVECFETAYKEQTVDPTERLRDSDTIGQVVILLFGSNGHNFSKDFHFVFSKT